MEQENFYDKFLEQIVILSHRFEEDNYDKFRFGYDGIDRSKDINATGLSQHLKFVCENHKEIQKMLNLLEDDESRDIVFKVLLFRSLGHLHVRLPRNNDKSKFNPLSEINILNAESCLIKKNTRMMESFIFGPLSLYKVPFEKSEIELEALQGNIIISFFIRQYYFERGKTNIIPMPGDYVIDAGGCFGDSSLAFGASVGKNGRVLCFEIVPDHLETCFDNFERNKSVSNFSLFNLALSNEDDKEIFFELSGPGSRITERETQFRVKTITIDKLIKDENLERLDFIKMDIEGAELDALEGARESIKKFRPKLAISAYHKNDDLINIINYIKSLEPSYKFFVEHYTIYGEETVIFAATEERLNPDEIFKEGLKFFNEKYFPESEKIFSLLLKIKPDNSDNSYYLGMSLFNQKNYKEALNALSNAIKLNKLNHIICLNMAICLEQIGQIKTAEIYFQKSKELRDKTNIFNLKTQKYKRSLVSILIPAYNYRFFEKALFSALDQSYENIEIIICDDSDSDKIENIVKSFESHFNYEKIIYIKNPFNLTGYKNCIKCFNLACGEYIKFLNDDDILDKYCLEKMTSYFDNYGENVSLITSKRQLIDKNGDNLEDKGFSKNPFEANSNVVFTYIDGKEFANFVLSNVTNFIGEPTTVLFRKRDLENNKPNLFSLNGKFIPGPIDVTMWINLLLKGNAVYIFETLSFFRIHDEQEQKQPDVIFFSTIYWFYLMFEAREAGLLKDSYQYIRMIDILSGTFERAIIAEKFSNEQKTELINKIYELNSLREKELKYLIEYAKNLPEKISPKDPMYYYLLAIEYFKLEKFNEAIEFFSKSIGFGMVNSEICNYFAICLEKTGDNKNADIFYQKSEKLKNNFT